MTNAKGFDDFGLDARSVLEHGFPSTFLKSRAFLYTQAGKVKMNESNWYRVEARVQKATAGTPLLLAIIPKVLIQNKDFSMKLRADAQFGSVPQFTLEQKRSNLFFPGLSSTIKLTTPSSTVPARAAVSMRHSEPSDDARRVIDTTYSFGGALAAPRATFALATRVIGDVLVGGKATMSGDARGLSALELGAVSGRATLLLKNALLGGIGARDMYIVSNWCQPIPDTNVTIAVEAASNRLAPRVGLVHQVTPALNTRYKFDLTSWRGAVASHYHLNSGVAIGAGVDMAANDTKDYRLGFSIELNKD